MQRIPCMRCLICVSLRDVCGTVFYHALLFTTVLGDSDIVDFQLPIADSCSKRFTFLSGSSLFILVQFIPVDSGASASP